MAHVTIIFMTPRSADFPLTFPLRASILHVKERLSQEHPRAPPVTSQRIVFAGRLLQDNDILESFFKPTIHDLTLPQKFQLVISQPPQQGVGQNWGQFPYPQGAYQQPFQGQQFPGQQFQGQQFQQQFQGPPFQGQPFPAQGPFPQLQFEVPVRVINIEFSMIIKLVVLVYVLGQGGSTERILALIFCAIAYYLYNGMGRHGQGQRDNQQPANQGDDDRTENNHNTQNEVPAFYHDPSVKGQVLRFVVPFFMSLLPSWKLPNLQPQPQPQPEQQQQQ